MLKRLAAGIEGKQRQVHTEGPKIRGLAILLVWGGEIQNSKVSGKARVRRNNVSWGPVGRPAQRATSLLDISWRDQPINLGRRRLFKCGGDLFFYVRDQDVTQVSLFADSANLSSLSPLTSDSIWVMSVACETGYGECAKKGNISTVTTWSLAGFVHPNPKG